MSEEDERERNRRVAVNLMRKALALLNRAQDVIAAARLNAETEAALGLCFQPRRFVADSLHPLHHERLFIDGMPAAGEFEDGGEPAFDFAFDTATNCSRSDNDPVDERTHC